MMIGPLCRTAARGFIAAFRSPVTCSSPKMVVVIAPARSRATPLAIAVFALVHAINFKVSFNNGVETAESELDDPRAAAKAEEATQAGAACTACADKAAPTAATESATPRR